MKTLDNADRQIDFFVSYTASDKHWAEWIAWVLEENKFSVKIQAWDFRAGSNFVVEMNKAAADSSHTLAVVSQDYLNKSKFGTAEWSAAFAKDPDGSGRRLVPVRVRECEIEGLLGPIIYIDLVGKTESEARQDLVDGVKGERAKPTKIPPFPGANASKHATRAPVFPGSRILSDGPPVPHHVPRIHRTPSDLDKFQFLQSSFATIARYFAQMGSELAQQGGVDFRIERDSATQFTAQIFVDGNIKRRGKIWIQNNGIAFSESRSGWVPDNSYNEMLSVSDNELAFSTLIGMVWGDEEKDLNIKQLTPEAAAEYLWRCFVSRLN